MSHPDGFCEHAIAAWKRCALCEVTQLESVIDQLRTQLAAAISGGADAAAQRDTALGLCKEREREIGTWMAENAELKRRMGNLAASHNYPRVQDVVCIDKLVRELAEVRADLGCARTAWEDERAAHAATEGQLQSAREMRDTYHRLNLEAREELAETRKALEEMTAARERLDQDWKRRHTAWLDQQAREVTEHASTRADLARSEARVKELLAERSMLIAGMSDG